MKPQTVWMGLAFTGWIALGWAVYLGGPDPTRIHGSGGRFEAHTVFKYGGNYTDVRRARDGEIVWAEWEFQKPAINPDATIFFFGGKNIAMVQKLAGEVPAFEFNFFKADGSSRERWMAHPGSETWDERINFGTNNSVLERLILMDGKWEPVVMRDHQRCLLIKGNWVQLTHTNGSWTTRSEQ